MESTIGFRESINRRPALAVVIASLGLAAILAMVVIGRLRELREARSVPKFSTQAFYTTDDGATEFADDVNKAPPFDHEGKQAVLAFVFTADGDKHRWVQYLQKYSDEAKAQVEALKSSKDSGAAMAMDPIGDRFYVKRPSAGEWVKMTDPKSGKIILPVAPPGMGTEVPRAVSP